MTKAKNPKYKLTNETCDVYYNGEFIRLYRIEALRDIDGYPTINVGAKGGFVQSKANLANKGNCWIADDAKVYGTSKVSGNARVTNKSVVIDSKIIEDADVSGNATVVGSNMSGCSSAENDTIIRDSKIFGGTSILHEARILESEIKVNTIGGDAIIDESIIEEEDFSEIIIKDGKFFQADIQGAREFILVPNVGTENGTLTVYPGKNNKVCVSRGCFSGTAEEFLAASVTAHLEESDNEEIYKEYKALIKIGKKRVKKALKKRIILDVSGSME
jgi:acetyltransferase-like isoleucine patch superfamily enzyme